MVIVPARRRNSFLGINTGATCPVNIKKYRLCVFPFSQLMFCQHVPNAPFSPYTVDSDCYHPFICKMSATITAESSVTVTLYRTVYIFYFVYQAWSF
jgi:hypothetical protein